MEIIPTSPTTRRIPEVEQRWLRLCCPRSRIHVRVLASSSYVADNVQHASSLSLIPHPSHSNATSSTSTSPSTRTGSDSRSASSSRVSVPCWPEACPTCLDRQAINTHNHAPTNYPQNGPARRGWSVRSRRTGSPPARSSACRTRPPRVAESETPLCPFRRAGRVQKAEQAVWHAWMRLSLRAVGRGILRCSCA